MKKRHIVLVLVAVLCLLVLGSGNADEEKPEYHFLAADAIKVGMTYSEVHDIFIANMDECREYYGPNSMRYYTHIYNGYGVYAAEDDKQVEFTFNDELIVTSVNVSPRKIPTLEDFYELKVGMSMHDVYNVLGVSHGQWTSGCVSNEYIADTGEHCRIYFCNADNSYTVQRILITGDVDGEWVTLYDSSDRKAWNF